MALVGLGVLLSETESDLPGGVFVKKTTDNVIELRMAGNMNELRINNLIGHDVKMQEKTPETCASPRF